MILHLTINIDSFNNNARMELDTENLAKWHKLTDKEKLRMLELAEEAITDQIGFVYEGTNSTNVEK